MASVEFGGGVSQVVGRVGGSVFQRGRAGSQLRTLPINTGRKQNLLSSARTSLASVSTYWRKLSVGDQLLWTATANTQTRYNRLGVPYTPSGFQLFCELNLNIALINSAAIISTPPALPTLPSITSPSCTIDVSTPLYDITGGIVNGSAAYNWLIEATRPASLGVHSVRAPFCIIYNEDDTTTLPPDMWSSYYKRYSFTPPADTVIFTRICAIHKADGWRSPSQVIRTIVTP